MTTPHPGAGKDEWRAWARTLDPVDAAAVVAVNGHLASLLASVDGLVLGYDALGDEMALTVGFDALPRLEDDGTMTLRRAGDRTRHALGFDQPTDASPEIDPVDVAVVLVPGRVYDRAGYRLGRGGGHYDRLLPRLAPTAVVVGVTAESRIVERLPREPHDRPMTHLATERGVLPT